MTTHTNKTSDEDESDLPTAGNASLPDGSQPVQQPAAPPVAGQLPTQQERQQNIETDPNAPAREIRPLT